MESYIKISDRARAPTCVYDVVYVNKKKISLSDVCDAAYVNKKNFSQRADVLVAVLCFIHFPPQTTVSE